MRHVGFVARGRTGTSGHMLSPRSYFQLPTQDSQMLHTAPCMRLRVQRAAWLKAQLIPFH